MNPMIHEKWVPAWQPNHPNRPMTSIRYITIHTTGNHNPTATAEAHARFQFNGGGGRQASWHYTVDAHEIWQSFKDQQMCWHTGTLTGNQTSIGIEICVNSQVGFKSACDKAAWLTALLLSRHDLAISSVVQHHHWSGKNCPAELRSNIWGINWKDFLTMVRKHLPDAKAPSFLAEAAIIALKNANVPFQEAHWHGVLTGSIHPKRKWTKMLINRIIDTRWNHLTPKIIGSTIMALLWQNGL